MNKKIMYLGLICVTQAVGVSFHSTDDMLGYVRRFLPNNPVILEAGGRDGEDSCRMKKVWPHATMHVFEPWGPSFEKLTQCTQGLSNVHRYQYALTTYSGTIEFHINFHNDGACSIGAPLDYNKHEFRTDTVSVPCTTLAAWAAAEGVDHIDFMWLDMEGHELYALMHAPKKLLNSIKAIYTEVDFVKVREGSCLYEDLKKFLASYGFVEVWKACYGRFGDALFIKKSLL